MRRMQRPDICPPTLRAVTDWHELRDSKGKFRPIWNKPDVRGVLIAMHGAVCSYCLSEMRLGDRGDVEHFRPKSRYPWLAYRFSNYFLSCIKCNQHLKRAEFPISDETRRAETDEQLVDEPRLLIDPVEDVRVEDWLGIDIEQTLFPFAPTRDAGDYRRRVETTIEFFELNSQLDLVRTRVNVIDSLLRQLRLAKRGELTADQQLELKKLASRRQPHGGARRLVIRDLAIGFEQFTELLPTDEEEMRWWIEHLILEIELVDSLIEKANSAKSKGRLEVRKKEYLWAMAATWHSPEPISRDWVENQIRDAGLIEDVEPLLLQLE